MNWNNQPAAESQPGSLDRLGQEHPQHSQAPPRRLIKVSKTSIFADGKDHEIFTMTMGEETIDLVPLKNWSQLDVHKWTVRGRLPGTPPGLDITHDHVKLSGEVVTIKEPDGCRKLEQLFEEWLDLERETLEMSRKKAQAKPSATVESAQRSPQTIHFEVEVDKSGQVHIRCLRGKEVLALIGLNVPGFHNLCSQGLMRKPHKVAVGALHNWVELDGELFSFEKGQNDAARLNQVLNTRYLPMAAVGQGKDIVVFENAASSTGFDIQFPTIVAGTPENHRRPLNEETLDQLQDPVRCGLLPKRLIIKLMRPCLVFKEKTPDGGERYLDPNPANVVTVVDDEGQKRTIDLSKPVNYLHLDAVELTAVFNHPAINQHSRPAPDGSAVDLLNKASPPAAAPRAEPPPAPPAPPVPDPTAPPPTKAPPAAAAVPPVTVAPLTMSAPPIAAVSAAAPVRRAAPPPPPPAVPGAAATGVARSDRPALEAGSKPAPGAQARSFPNLWLEQVLTQPPIRYDWFGCLVYRQIAEELGNSREGRLGPSACWAAAMSEVTDVQDPQFKGVFLTEKGGFGYLNQGHLARFHNGVAFLGTKEDALEGIGIHLEGVGFDVEGRVVFIVTEDYRSKFGVPDATVGDGITRLRTAGAMILDVQEVLRSPDPLAVVWTVPAQQADPNDPQVRESRRSEPEETQDVPS